MGSTMETQVLGHWGASKLGKAQDEDTEKILSPLPRTFHLNMSQLLDLQPSSSGKCNCLLFLKNSRKEPSLFGLS